MLFPNVYAARDRKSAGETPVLINFMQFDFRI